MTSDFVYANGVHLCERLPPVPAAAHYTNVSDLVVGTKGRSNGMDMGTARACNPYVQEHIDMVQQHPRRRPVHQPRRWPSRKAP